jgi:hypothetical protein
LERGFATVTHLGRGLGGEKARGRGWATHGGVGAVDTRPDSPVHPLPQKLKDEIADVFAQIDCFETAEER